MKAAPNSKLAELVTQAPPDDDPSSRPAPGLATQPAAPSYAAYSSSQAKEDCPCKCLFWRANEPKLASVVPVPSDDKDLPCDKPQEIPTIQVPRIAPQQPEMTPAPQAAPRSPEPEKVSQEPAAAPQEEPAQLGPQVGSNIGRKTLVLDLDETLVHSSFRVVQTADIIISVELEGEHHRVFVRKRPGVDEFLKRVAQLYEVVVYTASMAKYANPLLDELDKDSVVAFRLFREACTRQPNGYVKDLSKLGRNLKDVIIIDNSPTCYALQPHNAIPIKTWRDDPSDRELLDLFPILYSLADVEDIPMVLKQIVWTPDE